MAKKAEQKPNTKSVQKPRKSPTNPIAGLLIVIGKPFYSILSFIFLGIFISLALIGRTTRSLIHLLKNIRLPVLKPFKWPRVTLSKIHFKAPKKILILFLFMTTLGLTTYTTIIRELPSPTELNIRQPDVSTKIYDRNGKLLYKIFKDKNRTLVSLSTIPVNVQLATLAAEDAEFYNHSGFSIKGISRAFLSNIKNGSVQGGSTITQQLVKNVLLSPEKTLTRKIKELILSIEVESTYTKNEILEMYMNEVSYGGTAYGIEEASETYFGKNVNNLSLSEGAFLAGLPKSPTLYSPFGQNPDLSIERQKEVLHLMKINKFITREQETDALNEPLIFIANKTAIKAPHFVMYIRQQLVDKYGENMVEKGGLEVTTSLDLDIQERSEKIVKDEIEKLKGLHVGNGGAIILDPRNGEILGMVGSKDYFDIKADGNVNVTLQLRQPGSAIKIVNYAYALSNGFSPASIIDDSPITYVTPGSPPYSPVNYDGQFRGKITLRSALAQSRNIPAVKILASYGVTKMVEMGENLGITTWTDPSQYGLSLTLGGGAVKLIDLSQVYATIADSGIKHKLVPILQIKDYKGRILETNGAKKEIEKALDPRVAFVLTDILKDNIARSPEFGLNSYLVVKNHPEVAVKTGTSNDLRDNWTAGYNQDYVVVTWVGNNDNSPMNRIASGITGASPIWNKIMTGLLHDNPSIDWKVPNKLSSLNICVLTGTLPCNGCPSKQEWFLDENRPLKACTPELIQKIINPTPIPGNQILDSGASTVR